MARASGDATDDGPGQVRPAPPASRSGSAEITRDPGAESAPNIEDKKELNAEGAPASNPDDDPRVPSNDPIAHWSSPEEREADRLLVERARGGDHRAFRSLFDKYHKRAFAVAYGVLKNRHDALDVVQEGFVKVHRHLDNFEGTSSFYTWLYRIVMNLAIDSLRRRKTSRPVEYDDAVARDGDALGEETIVARMLDANPRKAAIRRELVAKIDAALAELPDYHREVILLREIDGMSYEEMSEVLDVPKGTIMSRLFHARKKMQAALADYVDGDMDIEEE